MKNIVLIGMPGCGKSTVGVLLAKAMGYDFVDTDVLLQVASGGKLQEILDREGRNAFLLLEERVVRAWSGQSTVVATGGSVVYRPLAMEALRQNGVIVYLKLPYSVIRRRIQNLATRGVALREGQTLRDLYEERAPLYEQACDVVFEPPKGGAAKAAAALAEMALNWGDR